MISVKEKIAYGLGDTASNIVFQTVMLFLSFFYTDIFGISPAVVGTLFLVVRIFDAITDPLMGALTDRTRTRWGQFRPYLLWLSVPFGLISILAFTTPDLPYNQKVIYAFITYALLMAVYTAINIPYSALGGVLTTNPDERVSIQSYRFVFGMIGGLIVTTLTLPLVEYFGEGDNAKGYQLTIAAMSAFGFVMFILCFLGTKERVLPPKDQTTSFKADLKALWQNDQWRVLSVIAIFVLVGIVMRTTLAIYYVKDYLGRPDLITAFVTTGMIANIIGVSLASRIAAKFCKIRVYLIVQLIASAFCLAAYFVAPEQITLAFSLYFLWSFTLQIGTPILWSKMADVVDYGHAKTGIRINGMIYSAIIFFIKMGIALGGAFAGWLLAYYGYSADQEMSHETRQGILASFTLYPIIPLLLVAFFLRFYKLTDKRIKDIQTALPSG